MANDVTVRVRVKEQLGKDIGELGSILAQTLGGAVIPLTGAVAALGVQLVGAGAAAGVFGLAVGPQVSQMKTLADRQDALTDAIATYGKESKEATKAQLKYDGTLKQMPKSTKEAALGLIALKDKFGDWSDSLASTTMPVFTHAMKGLSNTFPLLTPLVKEVSKEFLGLSKRFEAFSKTDRFKDLVAQFSHFAAGALHDVVTFLERGGKAAAKFAGSEGLKNFLAEGKENLPGVVAALKDLATFIGRFVEAAGPIAGLQLKVFEILADTLNKIPTDVLEILVPLLIGLAGAMKLVSLGMAAFSMIKGLVLGFQLLTGATLELDAAMAANPVGVVVLALAALAFGLIYAYNHSKKFRVFVGQAFDGVKIAGAEMAHMLLIVFKAILDVWMITVGGILHGAAAAFGWVPGLGGKLKSLDKAFGGLRDGVNEKFDDMIGKTKEWSKSANESFRTRKLKADITDWQSKLDAAKKKLKSVPESKRAKLRGEISDLEAKIKRAQGKINAVHGKTVVIDINERVRRTGVQRDSVLTGSYGYAHGGVVGHAAEGGSRSGFSLVGEHGPELVRLPMGSSVYTNSDTGRMLGGGGPGGGRFVLEIRSGGSRVDDLLVDLLKKAIRYRGGNVQGVLGT